jgi:chemotaxis response regulator CheB
MPFLISGSADLHGSRDGPKKRHGAKAEVGLGPSAGGITVLQQFFSDMAPDSGLVFVVVMHVSPEYESNLASIIQQKTAMPVAQVLKAAKLQPNHFYVFPPNKPLRSSRRKEELQSVNEELIRSTTSRKTTWKS